MMCGWGAGHEGVQRTLDLAGVRGANGAGGPAGVHLGAPAPAETQGVQCKVIDDWAVEDFWWVDQDGADRRRLALRLVALQGVDIDVGDSARPRVRMEALDCSRSVLSRCDEGIRWQLEVRGGRSSG